MDTRHHYNIVIAEADPEVASMLGFSLETQFGAAVFESRDSESALQFIQKVGGINLVIVSGADNFRGLIEHIKQRQNTEEMRCIIAVDKKIKDTTFLAHPSILGVAKRSNLIEDVTKLLKEKFLDGEVIETPSESYCRIGASLLQLAPPLAGDIFIRLSENKFLKLFLKGDKIEPSDIEKYWKQKNVQYFYVRHSEVHYFLNRFNEEIERVVRDSHAEDTVVRALSHQIHETVHWMVNTIGVTDEVREMTRQNVRMVIKTVGIQPQLNSIFDRIGREMNQYIVSHSLTVGEVACVLAANLEWHSDLTFQKLVMASLFHDITLKNHELAKARSLEEVKIRPDLLLLDSYDDFVYHGKKAEELVSQIKNLPPDVDQIILQHHEKPDGSGFPRGLISQQFSPLSCIFIIAHAFVDFALSSPKAVDLSDFITAKKDEYNSGYFKRIIRSLEERNTKRGS